MKRSTLPRTPLRRKSGWNPRRRRRTPEEQTRHTEACTCAAGHRHDSVPERRRCDELSMLERAGNITDLRQQTKVVLLPRSEGAPEIAWKVDFVYQQDGRAVWEDAKQRKSGRLSSLTEILTPAERLLVKLWRHFGPGLLRITGWHDGRGYTIRTVMPMQDSDQL